KEPMRDAKGNPVPCNFCNDLSFKGRLGIYEVMVIDDEIRNVIAGGGTDSQIRQAQRGKRGRLLQEMALAHVQAGETSVEEVLRVLKPDSESGGSSRPKSGAGPAPASGRPPSSPRPPSRGPTPAPRERSSQPRRAEP
ncbi:MAG: hypothetical protein ABSH08_12150, partial [Tepidisphaeraceae bacterium]